MIGAEMIAASDWGLGWVIFDAKEFLNADIMLASLAVIGAIGYAVRTPSVRLDRAGDRAALGHGASRPRVSAHDPESGNRFSVKIIRKRKNKRAYEEHGPDRN